MRKFLVYVIVLSCLALPSVSSAFNTIVALGDSLSDTGNSHNLTSALRQQDPSIPQAAPSGLYWQGRFSNGPVWVEYLAQTLGAGLDCRAFGGSPTSGLGYGMFPGLVQQVAGLGFGSYEETLFTVWSGANDFTQGLTTDPTVPVDNIIASLALLEIKGAEHILVSNLPDLGETPRMLAASEAERQASTQLSLAFNSYLDMQLGLLSAAPGFDATIYRMDAISLMNDAEDVFTNTTDGALFALGPEEAWKIGEHDYLFWDDVHPTAAAHKIVADRAVSALGVSTPLPSSIFMLAFGLGFLCRIKRRA